MSFEETRSILGTIIQKPQLTDQLLSRPPFKFLVDIVSNVVHSTGYLKNEFSKEELEAAGNDKNTKIEFLDKLIKIVNIDGELENVKTAKIIAGKEAEETNKLLQKLGRNASLLRNEEGIKKKSKNKEKSSKSSDRKSKKEVDPEKKKEKREKSSDRKGEKNKEKDKKEKKSSVKERHKSKEPKLKEGVEKNGKKKKDKILRRGDSMIAINGDAPNSQKNDNEQNHKDEGYDDQEGSSSKINNEPGNEPENARQRLHSAISPVKTDDSGMGDESPRPPPAAERAALLRMATGAGRPQTSMGRPGTAASRPAPPKIKKKQIATIDNSPQPVVELKSEIISETVVKEDHDDDNFVIEQDEFEEMPATISEAVDEEDRGALVQKIMDKKAELEDVVTPADSLENEITSVNVEKEKVKFLQEKLQDLTKSAFPLARIFEYANDDIESMIKELEKWRLEQRKNEQLEQNKKAAGYGDSNRLYDMIRNLQKEIQDIKEELATTRSRVISNDERIKLLVQNI